MAAKYLTSICLLAVLVFGFSSIGTAQTQNFSIPSSAYIYKGGGPWPVRSTGKTVLNIASKKNRQINQLTMEFSPDASRAVRSIRPCSGSQFSPDTSGSCVPRVQRSRDRATCVRARATDGRAIGQRLQNTYSAELIDCKLLWARSSSG